MTVRTRTAVLAVAVIMDLTCGDKRSVNRIRRCAAGNRIMTTVTGRIRIGDRGAVVNCCLRYCMDPFPTIRCRRMTGGTGRRVPGIDIRLGQQGGAVSLGCITVYTE